MKKKMIMLVAAAMMTLSASSAFAAFGNFDLIRVVSDKTVGSTLEIATDLGNINTLAGLSNATVGGGIADAFTNFTQGHDVSKLTVTYYAVNRTSLLNGNLYLSANVTTAPSTPGVTQFQNKLASTSTTASVNKYYQSISATATTVVANNTNASSLSGILGSTTIGNYGGYAVNFATNTNLSLASIATAPIATTVWQFGPVAGANMATAYTGVKVLDLTTNADGSTTINAVATAATPIPAAAWLLGSGLMGLFGMRRKMKA